MVPGVRFGPWVGLDLAGVPPSQKPYPARPSGLKAGSEFMGVEHVGPAWLATIRRPGTIRRPATSGVTGAVGNAGAAGAATGQSASHSASQLTSQLSGQSEAFEFDLFRGTFATEFEAGCEFARAFRLLYIWPEVNAPGNRRPISRNKLDNLLVQMKWRAELKKKMGANQKVILAPPLLHNQPRFSE